MNDKIIALLDKKTISEITFNFLNKQGIELFFEVDDQAKSSDEVVTIVKKAIKDTDFGKGIYFSVTAQ